MGSPAEMSALRHSRSRRAGLGLWLIAGILALVGCQVPVGFEQGLAAFNLGGIAASGQAVTLTGRVAWPGSRTSQASFTDVARASTVSIIDSVSNQVMATTLTNPDLTFVLTVGNLEIFRTYYLEAVKGIGENKAANDAARLRTLMRWTSATNYQSITVPSLTVSVETTALSIIANLRSLNPDSLLGRIDLGPPKTFDTVGAGVTQEDLDAVVDLVNQALTSNRDPLFALRFDGTNYLADLRGMLEPAAMGPPLPYIMGLSRYQAAPGDTVTLYGGNLDSPPAANILKIGTVAFTVVSGASDHQKLTLPATATSGTMVQTTSNRTASTPFGIVSPLGGNLGGTKARPTAAPDKTVVGAVIPRLTGMFPEPR